MENIYNEHFVPAWTYKANGSTKQMSDAVADLVDVVENYAGKEKATIIEKRVAKSEVGEGYYIYAQFETPLMGFGKLLHTPSYIL